MSIEKFGPYPEHLPSGKAPYPIILVDTTPLAKAMVKLKDKFELDYPMETETIIEEGSKQELVKAALVSLSFTLPRQSFKLKKEARGLEIKAGAYKGTATSAMYYFRQEVEVNGVAKKEDALSELRNFIAAWKGEHATWTQYWDGTSRLLPIKLAQRYMQADAAYVKKFPEMKDRFLVKYNDWFVNAPERLGEWFGSSNFPSFVECEYAIGVKRSFLPLPESEQWQRIGMIAPDLSDMFQKSTDDKVKKARDQSTGETFAKVLNQLQKVSTALEGDKSKLTDTMVQTLIEIAELAPSFDLGGNAHLVSLAGKTAEKFKTITAEDVKKSSTAKAMALAEARGLIDSFTPHARKFYTEEEVGETA